MKVLERAITPAGEKIQIENWSADDPDLHEYGDLIGAYPKTQAGYSYRAQCQFESYEAAKDAFERIKSGDACLDDFNFTSHKSGKTIPFRQFRFGY